MNEPQKKFSSKSKVPRSRLKNLGKWRSHVVTGNLELGTWNLERLCHPSSAVCAILLALCLSFAPAPAAAEVTDAQVKEVARELACLCDTCPRRPLDECACGWADKNRQRIADALTAGQDKQTIVAAFVKDFGQEAFSSPPAEGFFLTAWIMPFLVLALGGLLVRIVLRNWSRDKRVPVANQASQTELDDDYRTRLTRELEEGDT